MNNFSEETDARSAPESSHQELLRLSGYDAKLVLISFLAMGIYDIARGS
jgi:hypothetical protein